MLRSSSKRAVVFLALLLLCVPSAPRAGASGLMQETGTLPYCGDMAFETVNRYFFSPAYAEDSVVFAVATRSTDENWKLYRSEDGGLTWQFNADEYVYELSFSPSYDVDQTIFAVPYSSEANQSYALRSSDRGVTWQRVFTPADGPSLRGFSTLALADADTLYYGKASAPISSNPLARGLFRLTFSETGVTWEQLTFRNVDSITLSPDYARDQTLFIGETAYKIIFGLRKSADAGKTWAPASDGMNLSPNSGGGGFAEASFAPDYPVDPVIFARTVSRYYRSLTGGTSWERVDWLPERFEGASLTEPHWVFSPNFTEDRTAWIDFGAWITRDAGDTWRPTHGTQVMDLAARAWCEGDRCGTLLLGGGSGWDERAGVYKSYDLGWTWQCADAPAPGWWPNVPPVVATWLPVVFK